MTLKSSTYGKRLVNHRQVPFRLQNSGLPGCSDLQKLLRRDIAPSAAGVIREISIGIRGACKTCAPAGLHFFGRTLLKHFMAEAFARAYCFKSISLKTTRQAEFPTKHAERKREEHGPWTD
jgi:hypothetical protein